MSEFDELLKLADTEVLYDASGYGVMWPQDLAAALRRVEAERDSAVEQNTLIAQESAKTIARLAEYERFRGDAEKVAEKLGWPYSAKFGVCLLYTSDAADE